MTLHVAHDFNRDAYVEQIVPGCVLGGPAGLMGRPVTGRQFLDDFLASDRWDGFAAMTRTSFQPREPRLTGIWPLKYDLLSTAA